jgi:hypothetical protein
LFPEGVLGRSFVADVHVPWLDDEKDACAGDVALGRAICFMGCNKTRDEGCDGLIARKAWKRISLTWGTLAI